jgi:hypothetical protein
MSTTSASEIAALAQAESGSCRYRTVLAAKKGHLIAVASTLLRHLRRRQFRHCSTSRRKNGQVCNMFCHSRVNAVANDDPLSAEPMTLKQSPQGGLF